MAVQTDDELTAIRAARLQQQSAQHEKTLIESAQRAATIAQEEQSIELMLRQILTQEARARLTRLSLVEPQRVKILKQKLIEQSQAGEIDQPLNDATLKNWLLQQSKSRSNASIRRI